MSGKVVISLHDVAPGSEHASRKWLQIVERHGMRASLLVIAGPWRGHSLAGDDRFAEWLRQAQGRGHELVLHGWHHHAVRDALATPSALHRLYGAARARGCAEFHELGVDAARRRIEAGQAVMHHHGFDPRGFTPPGWLASAGTLQALRELGFAYTTTQWSVHDLRSDQRLQLMATSQRPGSRLARPAAAANERLAQRRFAAGRSLRLALHPDDLGTPGLRASTERTLADALVNGIESLTYGELVSRVAPAVRHAAGTKVGAA
ncbi:MAG: polysaccharide deacetylase family protein [Actinomycetota bacterium]|nr:polysaccharide deacetylase family protein [Actinomycetota bacterium]